MNHILTRIKIIIKNKTSLRCYCKCVKNKPPWNVLFFGTDEFSVDSLKVLTSEYRTGELLSNLEVVTSIKSQKNSIENFAIKENLRLHDWPIHLSECRRFHIGLVVSFGHLISHDIINSFSLGILNVHASLLPRWRGAAPIIHAIANGDDRTGITIMKIKPFKFDVGEIVAQASFDIPHEMKMPDLYSNLANLGAKMLVKSLKDLPENLLFAIPQPKEEVTFAPKVNADMAHIKWDKLSARNVYNLYRALTGMFSLTTTFNEIPIKLFDITENKNDSSKDTKIVPGLVIYNKKNKILKVQCGDGNWINVERVGVPGKRTMSATDFNNGFLSKHIQNIKVFR